MQLYTRATSSCAFRVRIGLNIKELAYESVPMKAVDQGVEPFRSLNPQRLVPFLVNGSEKIGQSIAILEYLDEQFPHKPALLPVDAAGRGRVRAMAQYIVSEIQPMQNTRLDPELKRLGVDDMAWKAHWVKVGFAALETMLSSSESGAFCHADVPSMADCCLIPQVWNAVHRYSINLSEYPAIERVYSQCVSLPVFADAMPEKQADYAPPQG